MTLYDMTNLTQEHLDFKVKVSKFLVVKFNLVHEKCGVGEARDELLITKAYTLASNILCRS